MRPRCSLFTLACVGIASLPVAQAPRPLPTNRLGMPVVEADGTRRTYTRRELEAQPAASATRSGAGAGPATTNRPPAFGYAGFGAGIGLSHIAIGPSPRGPEIYVGGGQATFGGNDYWYTLRFDAAAGSYAQIRFSQHFPAGIRRLLVGDVDANPGLEIVVCLADGRILVHDQATKALLRQVATAATALNSARLVDLDGDSRDDILLCTANAVYGYRAAGTQILASTQLGGSDLVAGQMDADASLEIATTDGAVLDVATNTVQSRWAQGYGFRLEAVDFDGDGMQELIAAEAWNFCWAYDIDRNLPKWSIPVFNVGAIDVADVDNDGTPELLIGDAQWGNVHAHHLTTQQQLWTIRNPEHGVTDIAVADVDGDGTREVLWGSGATSSGSDRLYVGNAATQSIEWENLQLDGPFVGAVHGDVDGDGVGEFVAVSASSDAGYGAGRIVVIDEVTGRVEGISQETANNLGWTGIHDIVLHDFDNDGDQEIVIAAGTTYDALVEVYDYQRTGTFTEIWSNAVLPSGKTFYSVAVADVDGDGAVEIVAGSGTEHTGSDGVYVHVYDYATRALEWRSLQMGGFWSAITDLGVADLDGDGSREIAGMVEGGDVYVFDGTTRQLETIVSGTYRSLEVADVGGAPVLLLGNSSGGVEVVVFLQGTYRRLLTIPTGGSGPVDGLSFGPLLSLWTGAGSAFRLQVLGVSPVPFLVTDDHGNGIGRTALSPLGRAATVSSYAILGF